MQNYQPATTPMASSSEDTSKMGSNWYYNSAQQNHPNPTIAQQQSLQQGFKNNYCLNQQYSANSSPSPSTVYYNGSENYYNNTTFHSPVNSSPLADNRDGAIIYNQNTYYNQQNSYYNYNSM